LARAKELDEHAAKVETAKKEALKPVATKVVSTVVKDSKSGPKKSSFS